MALFKSRKGHAGSMPPTQRTRPPTSSDRGQSAGRANMDRGITTTTNPNQLAPVARHHLHPPAPSREDTSPRRFDPSSHVRALHGKPTTAVFLEGVNAHTSSDAVSRDRPASAVQQLSLHHPSVASSGLSVSGSKDESDTADSSSIRSSNVFGFATPAVPSVFGDTSSKTDNAALQPGPVENQGGVEEGPGFLTEVDDVTPDFEEEFEPVERGDPGLNNG